MPVLRLADLYATSTGAAEAPAAEIGETTRYVLAAPWRVPGEPIDASTLASMTRAPVAYTFRCPPDAARRRFVVALRGYTRPAADDAARPLFEVANRGRCPRQPDRPRTVSLRGLPHTALDSGRADLILLPPRRIATDWIELPGGAWLETDVGLFGDRAPGGARGADFAVRAVNPQGASMTVASQRLGRVKWKEEGGQPAIQDGGSWRAVSADLDGVRRRLGPRVRLVFEARGRGRSSLVPVWGDPTIFVRRPRAAGRRWNVVLVSLDTLRADHLGLYGFPAPVSPQLDAFGAAGSVFDEAVTLANWTLPSHATMLTGVDPCVHGFRGALGAGPGIASPLPPGVVPLAETMRRAGWLTTAITEDGYLHPTIFQRGFDRFDASKHPHQGQIETTFGKASMWLREHADQEFLLFLHTYQVHAPYDPPEPYRTTFAGADADLPNAADAAAYTGEVAYTDAVMGRLLALLDELRLADHTIVVVTSDHGESFGDHGTSRHGMSLHEEEVHVPLLWRAPGLIRAGARVGDLAALSDVVPTLLDLLGLPPPPVLTGVSLYDLMRADRPPATLPSGRTVVIEGMAAKSVHTRTWKAIFTGPTLRLYSLPGDPKETSPTLLTQHAPTEAVLAEHTARCETLHARVGTPRAAPQRAHTDPDLDARLRALGYVR